MEKEIGRSESITWPVAGLANLISIYAGIFRWIRYDSENIEVVLKIMSISIWRIYLCVFFFCHKFHIYFFKFTSFILWVACSIIFYIDYIVNGLHRKKGEKKNERGRMSERVRKRHRRQQNMKHRKCVSRPRTMSFVCALWVRIFSTSLYFVCVYMYI